MLALAACGQRSRCCICMVWGDTFLRARDAEALRPQIRNSGRLDPQGIYGFMGSKRKVLENGPYVK